MSRVTQNRLDYYRAREATENEMAEKALSKATKRIHEGMAKEYRQIIENLRETDESPELNVVTDI